MAIIKDVTVKINNGTATLDAPVQFYEKDHDVELRFKLMDYKYKYDKDPQNILNSVDEDILEAYTTIVNPKGYELEQINGVVKNDVVIFRLDPTYTDELDELGTYKLQIHIKCTHSEFTIPPITFEVLQRLRGIKVVTDGEDEVDNSEILDNSSKFVSDETGKLIIEWKKGDMISSTKLNAMVDVINDAVDEEKIRQENEIEREKKAANKIQELENTRVEYVNKFDDELDSFADQVDESMTDYETRFNALTVSQQQDAEVIDARDGEQTLRARLERDIQKPSIIYEEVEGSYINAYTTSGYAQNVEILGNTIQNQNDLADIRSVGDKVEGQELYEIPVLSTNKNLFNYENLLEKKYHSVINQDGTDVIKFSHGLKKFYQLNFKPNTQYTLSYDSKLDSSSAGGIFIDFVYTDGGKTSSKFMNNTEWTYYTVTSSIDKTIAYIQQFWSNTGITYLKNIQLEEGTVATPYEPYQEDKLTILSPVQLEKVGDVADRIICKDCVWGVEKNVETVTFNGSEDWQYNANGDDNLTNTIRLNTKLKTTGIETLSIMKNFKFLTITNVDEEGHAIKNTGTKVFIRINKTRLSTADAEGFKLYLKSNPVTIYYQTTQPQFIPLPYDQQIKLRTFANKTNIHFECEIEPTLKASVPKSIGAIVNTHTEQIDNLSKELDRVKKLEESTVSTVTTESSFTTVAETSNGYFEDVKLEGKTLVNLRPINPIIVRDNCSYSNGKGIINVTNGSDVTIGSIQFDNSILRPNTAYTAIFEVSGDYNYKVGFDYGKNQGIVSELTSGKHIISFTTASNIDRSGHLSFWSTDIKQGQFIFENFIILEGDHTQNPPEYFEGIKSVGQDVDDITIATTNAPMLFGKGGKK